MRAPTEKVISSIRDTLNLRGTRVHDIRSIASNSIDVTTMDANPSAQQEINEICRNHQLGRSYLMLESYEFDNIRDDLPQTDHVLVFHRRSHELQERLEQLAQESLPGCRQNPSITIQYEQCLFAGRIPGLWGNEPPRCCICQKPVPDTGAAHSRKMKQERIYRHQECGDFHPTPRKDER